MPFTGPQLHGCASVAFLLSVSSTFRLSVASVDPSSSLLQFGDAAKGLSEPETDFSFYTQALLAVVAALLATFLRYSPGSPLKWEQPATGPRIFGGRAEKMQELLKKLPLLHLPEHPPLFMSSPVLQLVLFAAQQGLGELVARWRYSFDEEELEVEVPGQGPATRDAVLLSWLRREELPQDTPVVLLAPGLLCTKENLPGTATYDALLTRKCRVAVFHKRAMGGRLKAPVFHLFGHPSDFDAAVKHIVARYPKAPLHIVGFSSGNGLTGSHAALYSQKNPPNVRSYALLSGGADYNVAFAPASGDFRSTLLLDWGLLLLTKVRAILPNRTVLKKADPAGFSSVIMSQKMQDLYTLCHRHFSGFPADQQELAEKSLNPFSTGPDCLRGCTAPLLWVLTEDDPVLPGGPPQDWLDLIESMPNCALALYKYGSHCACYDSWRLTRWLDQLLLEWLDVHGLTKAV